MTNSSGAVGTVNHVSHPAKNETVGFLASTYSVGNAMNPSGPCHPLARKGKGWGSCDDSRVCLGLRPGSVLVTSTPLVLTDRVQTGQLGRLLAEVIWP